MGGRGGASSAAAKGGIAGATSEQKHRIERFKNIISSKNYYSDPKFSMNKDGDISFSYIETQIIQHVHNSKMQDPSKNDIYERRINHTGIIRKNGKVSRNKSIKEDILIKKGKK